MRRQEVKHPIWGTPVERWICPETGTHYEFLWTENGQYVCTQCRPNGPSLGKRLHDLNDKRKGEKK